MPQFRSKPVVIEAIQFRADDSLKSLEIMVDTWGESFQKALGQPHADGRMIIKTLEGDHTADYGDWIIKGLIGEFYPCKDEVFQRKYEPA